MQRPWGREGREKSNLSKEHCKTRMLGVEGQGIHGLKAVVVNVTSFPEDFLFVFHNIKHNSPKHTSRWN